MSSASKRKARGGPVAPAENISSIFTARRDLLAGVRKLVKNYRLSVEEADLLVSLYGARELDWDDLLHDKDGYVVLKELELYLVHNPSLLSRRIRKLADGKAPLLEITEVDPASGLHFNSKRVRITKEGVKRIEPVWSGYQYLSAKLLDGIPQRLLDAHHAVNEEISTRMRARRSGLDDLFPGNT
jgi:hypothetical protein